jgi:pimeloyl-ACP methyl ester carboxylesterase
MVKTPVKAFVKAMVKASDGVELYAEAHGEGIPLLFSCAYSTTHENWRAQIEPLVGCGFKVLLWDYRGHGLSACPESPDAYSTDQVVDDLGRVLDWGAPEQAAILVGHSFGGLASLHFTARRPAAVRALVLLASGPGFKNPEAAASWMERTERTARYIEERGLEAFVRGKAGATCVGRRPELPAARAAAAAIEAQSASSVATFARRVAGPAPPVIDALGSMEVPALVLVGEEDQPFLRAAEVMAAKLPQARLELLPGAGHVANLEEPEIFNASLLGFLGALGELAGARPEQAAAQGKPAQP